MLRPTTLASRRRPAPDHTSSQKAARRATPAAQRRHPGRKFRPVLVVANPAPRKSAMGVRRSGAFPGSLWPRRPLRLPTGNERSGHPRSRCAQAVAAIPDILGPCISACRLRLPVDRKIPVGATSTPRPGQCLRKVPFPTGAQRGAADLSFREDVPGRPPEQECQRSVDRGAPVCAGSEFPWSRETRPART